MVGTDRQTDRQTDRRRTILRLAMDPGQITRYSAVYVAVGAHQRDACEHSPVSGREGRKMSVLAFFVLAANVDEMPRTERRQCRWLGRCKHGLVGLFHG